MSPKRNKFERCVVDEHLILFLKTLFKTSLNFKIFSFVHHELRLAYLFCWPIINVEFQMLDLVFNFVPIYIDLIFTFFLVICKFIKYQSYYLIVVNYYYYLPIPSVHLIMLYICVFPPNNLLL